MAFVCLFVNSAARAANWTVTKTADTNDNICNADCSLREAIAAAASGDTIQFASPLFDLAQTVTLAFGEIYLNKTLTINGKGANLTTISGGNLSRVFQTEGNLTLNNLTVTGGVDTGIGGAGIYNNGTLTLNNCIVFGNSSRNVTIAQSRSGGGIFNNSGRTLIINDSVINGNWLRDASLARGGGIFNAGQATITRSTISGNAIFSPVNTGEGDGIFNSGTLTILDSTLSGNAVSTPGFNAGGAICNRGTANLANTTISGNVIDSSLSNLNYGGGIFNENAGCQ